MAEPLVVVIDDETTLAEVVIASVDDILDTEIIESSAIQSEDAIAALASAHLILVDQGLSDLAAGEPPVASNGLALIPVLREYLANTHERHPSFVLFSNRLDQLSALPQEARAHVLARSHNFEWALSKNTEDNAVGLETVVPSLAYGSLRIEEIFAGQRPAPHLDLPEARGTGEPVGPRELILLHEVLKLPDTDWRMEASRQIEMARPPIYTHTSRQSLAVPVRRWLLHRVIPYPTFLYGRENIAARLALPVDITEGLLANELAETFAPATYGGVYHDLDGPRYWRIGADAIIDALSDGDTETLRRALSRLANRDLAFVDHPRPVATLDPNTWQAENTPVPPSHAVRVQLDDWPAHAEPARVRLSAIDSTATASVVVEADRHRLSPRDDH